MKGEELIAQKERKISPFNGSANQRRSDQRTAFEDCGVVQKE